MKDESRCESECNTNEMEKESNYTGSSRSTYMKVFLKFGEQRMPLFVPTGLRTGIQIRSKATHRFVSESYADVCADIYADRSYLNQLR
jgi:hypothetical protein